MSPPGSFGRGRHGRRQRYDDAGLWLILVVGMVVVLVVLSGCSGRRPSLGPSLAPEDTTRATPHSLT
jgi:hypothetical protein